MSLRKIFTSLFRLSDPSTYVGHEGEIFFDPDTPTLKISDGVTPGGNLLSTAINLPIITISSSTESQSANDSVGTISGSGIGWSSPGAADVLYSITSTDTVTASGIIAHLSVNQTNTGFATAAGLAATGANGVRFSTGGNEENFVVVVYATTANGTFYSAPSVGSSRPLCLAEGTLITMADRSFKKIEDIAYSDNILVWDFDNRCFASSKPLWIMKSKRSRAYNSIVFSDGTELRTVGQHRIFNKEAGSFTYPLTSDTPIGTTSFTHDGSEVRVVSKRVVNEPVNYYNVITDHHINLFADGILTSCSMNNMYPIEDMRFVKSSRQVRFGIRRDEYYYGLRVAEQPHGNREIKAYIDRLIKSDSRFADR